MSASFLFWALIVVTTIAAVAVVLAVFAWPKDNSF